MSVIVRKTILITILMIVAIVFAYDQFVIRRRPIQIQAELMDLVNDTTHSFSEEEIQAIVDRPFEMIYESKQKKIVKFTWRGLSNRPHNLYVVYRKFRGSTLIWDATLTEPSASKPFINPNIIANSSEVRDSGPEISDGEAPRPARSPGGVGLVEEGG